MRFDGDAFISYAHLDNVELVEGRGGWVANLQRALQIRVAQLLGQGVAHLVGPEAAWQRRLRRHAGRAARSAWRRWSSVVSPRYVKSEWGRREMAEFCKAAEEQGGISVQDKARIFKVLKTPVPREKHPPEVQALLGYEFFKVDPVTGRVRELDEIFGAEGRARLLAQARRPRHDMCGLLEAARDAPADVAPDARARRVSGRNDQRSERPAGGNQARPASSTATRCCPDRPLPLAALECDRSGPRRPRALPHVHPHDRQDLQPRARRRRAVARGDAERAGDRRAQSQGRSRAWCGFRPGSRSNDARQQQVLEALRNDPRIRRRRRPARNAARGSADSHYDLARSADQAPAPSAARGAEPRRMSI